MSEASYEYTYAPETGLCYNGEKICGFGAQVVKVKKIVHRESNETETLYCVEVTKCTGAKEKLWHKDLRKINYFSSYTVNECFMDKTAKQLLLNKLMQEAEQLTPEKDTGDETGLWKLEGVYTYVLENGLQLKSFFKDENWHKHKIEKEELLDYINLVPGVTVILFFASLLGALKPFLHNMGVKCGMALALLGPPGTCKSTLARIFSLWLKTTRNEITFASHDWERRAEEIIYKKAGENVLLDDVRQLSDSAIQNRHMSRFEVLMHNYTEHHQGDCANLVITAEDMFSFGHFSSVDRLLPIRMPNMDAAKVEELKRKFNGLTKDILDRTVVFYIENLLGRMKQVQSKIEDYCNQYRNGDGVLEGRSPLRSQDHAFFIRLSEYMFRSYVFDIGMEEELRSALDSQRQIFEPDILKQSYKEHPQNYLEVFYEAIWHSEQLRLCRDWDAYENAQKGTSYLITDKKLYISRDTLEYGIISYLGHTIEIKDVTSALDKAGVLEKDKGAGRQKGFGRHGRYYVVTMWLLLKKLEEQGFPIPQKEKEMFRFSEAQKIF